MARQCDRKPGLYHQGPYVLSCTIFAITTYHSTNLHHHHHHTIHRQWGTVTLWMQKLRSSLLSWPFKNKTCCRSEQLSCMLRPLPENSCLQVLISAFLVPLTFIFFSSSSYFSAALVLIWLMLFVWASRIKYRSPYSSHKQFNTNNRHQSVWYCAP